MLKRFELLPGLKPLHHVLKSYPFERGAKVENLFF